MLVAIHQPHYLPWLRYFDKIARSDVFIVLDSVQFTKNGWQNRNKVKSASGPVLLTVPVHASLDDALTGVRIRQDGRWRKKHWKTLQQCYAKAPYFEEHAGFLEEVYGRSWERLAALNRCMLEYFVAALGIRTPLRYASELGVEGTATERLVELIRAVGGTRYYSGAFAVEEYLDQDLLVDEGIGLVLQHWEAPVYPQQHGAFVPDLSLLDLLMNCGPRSLSVLLGEDT